MTTMIEEYKFPPGEYVIGDPSYCFNTVDWNAVKEASRHFYESIVNFKNTTIFMVSTAHGDGCYTCALTEQVFLVDAGLIGIVPIKVVFGGRKEIDSKGLIVFESKHGGIAFYEEGTFYIEGLYEIETDPQIDCEDDLQDDDEEIQDEGEIA
ncbi:hypothetical protein ACQ4M3_01080 [Leptolyngbya sp. AN03gr2]|uniref:hypothetical protein n=1 Tax=unclassified Leptolyngbya TaxID=2650499 RepID=UPI003D3229D3